MATWSNEWLMMTLICVISNDTTDILHYLIICKHSSVTSLSTITNATFIKLRTFQQHHQKHLIEYFPKLYQMLPWLSSEMIMIHKIDCQFFKYFDIGHFIPHIFQNASACKLNSFQCYSLMHHMVSQHQNVIIRIHDDVIKWKRFPYYWPLCGETIGNRWNPHTKASGVELWCCLWCTHEHTVE